MGKVYQLQSTQRIPITLEKAWDFFSSPDNLLKMTPAFLNLKLTNELFGQKAYGGQIITYSVKPLWNLPFFWMTEITHVEPLKFFVDEQRKGPYKLWHHQHHFKQIQGGVEMTDLIHYRLGLGILGDLAHSLIVKEKLKEIFTFRYLKLIEIFGTLGQEPMNLKFQ
ncbi:MAG: SRPBCC family protein [Flavisolibacter sp.]